MIKVILWDIDNTLLDFTAAERVSLGRRFTEFGMGECTDEIAADYSAINMRFWEMLERGEKTKKEILTERFREFLSKYGGDPRRAEEFDRAYESGLPETIIFFDGAQEVLSALKGRLVQYGVTNGTKFVQERKLANSGLDRLLDRVFISEDVGYEKPDRRYFDAVLAGLDGVDPGEIMIVGDSLTSDIRGGVNAGIPTAWYIPEGKPLPEGLRIDFALRRLDQVPALLYAAAMFPRRKDTLTAKNSRSA